MLSLLIIFMVATPEPPGHQMSLRLPKDAPVQQPSDPNAVLLLTIDDKGAAVLGKTPLPNDYDQMVAALKAHPKAQADGRVVISADERVPYGKVVRVMGAAHEADIPEVGVASDRL